MRRSGMKVPPRHWLNSSSREDPTMWFLLFLALFVSHVQSQQLLGFYLVDTTTQEDLFELTDGTVVSLAETGDQLTIRVEVAFDGLVQIEFGFSQRFDGSPPYALGGDLTTPIASLAVPNTHTVTATAGTEVLSVTFAVITMAEDDVVTASPVAAPSGYQASPEGVLQGDLRQWSKITLGLEGPLTSEDADIRPQSFNAFMDYRLDVDFVWQNLTWTVPGYFAADGNAAISGATRGSVWLCHFVPPHPGDYTYVATMWSGEEAAVANDTRFSNILADVSGEFTVQANEGARGRLERVPGYRYYRWAGTGEWFVKAGADSPENFLSYADFDNTPDVKGFLKTWQPHVQDWFEGDPEWNGLGKGIIGALNYLADQGMNAVSFLTFNVGGDDGAVFPFVSMDSFRRYDVSKLAQWQIVLEHASDLGLFLHFKTQETEMDRLLDGGSLFSERRLYYRELIARFGYNLALNWNLGEETTLTTEELLSYAEYITSIDPYNSPIVVHTYPNQKEQVYAPLLGEMDFDGPSLQSRPGDVYSDTFTWVNQSTAAGWPWVVSNDEQSPATRGVLPDANDAGHNAIRKQALWGNLMAGGAGVEYYFGYEFPNSDLTCEDWRSRQNMWDQSRYALEFFSGIPFQDMYPRVELASGPNWALATETMNLIVVYFRAQDSVTVDLRASLQQGGYSVFWYNPRVGGDLVEAESSPVQAGDRVTFARRDPNEATGVDWVLVFEAIAVPTLSPSNAPSVVSSSEPTMLTTDSPTVTPSAPPTVAPVMIEVPGEPTESIPAPVDEPATEAPASTEGETPVTSSTDAPASTPVEVPMEAPIESPIDAPVVTSTESPADVPVDVPTKVPAEAPVDSPVEVPVEPNGPVGEAEEVPTSSPVEDREVESSVDAISPHVNSMLMLFFSL